MLSSLVLFEYLQSAPTRSFIWWSDCRACTTDEQRWAEYLLRLWVKSPCRCLPLHVWELVWTLSWIFLKNWIPSWHASIFLWSEAHPSPYVEGTRGNNSVQLKLLKFLMLFLLYESIKQNKLPKIYSEEDYQGKMSSSAVNFAGVLSLMQIIRIYQSQWKVFHLTCSSSVYLWPLLQTFGLFFLMQYMAPIRPMTLTHCICDKLQSTEFKNSFWLLAEISMQ